jgi:hypothetical protein
MTTGRRDDGIEERGDRGTTGSRDGNRERDDRIRAANAARQSVLYNTARVSRHDNLIIGGTVLC